MKKLLFLFAIAATLFACTKNSKPEFLQEQKNQRKSSAITLTALSATDTTFSGDKWAFVVIDTVAKVTGGNKVYFTVHTNSLPILSSGVFVTSDSTNGWNSIGSGQWGSVWDSPFSTNTFDGYPGQFPQSRLYKAVATIGGIPGSVYSVEYLAN